MKSILQTTMTTSMRDRGICLFCGTEHFNFDNDKICTRCLVCGKDGVFRANDIAKAHAILTAQNAADRYRKLHT